MARIGKTPGQIGEQLLDERPGDTRTGKRIVDLRIDVPRANDPKGKWVVNGRTCSTAGEAIALVAHAINRADDLNRQGKFHV
jgi:hypothetical protein